MLETFGEYMYYLLSTPFKQARKARNQWYIYFKVTGRLFDKNKTMLRRAREEGMVRTASPRMLPEHGLDRKLTRYEGETWENFRVRLMMYADTCRLGGTEVGTLQAVRSLGFTDVEMVPAYELEGSREHWAEFYVILSRDIDDSFDIGHDIIRREVRRVKKVSGLDRYRFLYRIQDARLEECIRPHNILIRAEVRWYNNNILNGEHNNDGSIHHDNVIGNHLPYLHIRSRMEEREKGRLTCTTWHHWRIHDGSTYNDGAKHMDAQVIEEEI